MDEAGQGLVLSSPPKRGVAVVRMQNQNARNDRSDNSFGRRAIIGREHSAVERIPKLGDPNKVKNVKRIGDYTWSIVYMHPKAPY
jgi:hypothetical protein